MHAVGGALGFFVFVVVAVVVVVVFFPLFSTVFFLSPNSPPFDVGE